MTTSLDFPGPDGVPSPRDDVPVPRHDVPGPRDGLDEGSLAELAQDSREIEIEIEVDVAAPRASAGWAFCPIDVPDDASALIDGIATYGM